MLQPRLNLKVSQRQALTPGLVQMVSVLALNKLELREMINTEMIENPVLEELEETVYARRARRGSRAVSNRLTVLPTTRFPKLLQPRLNLKVSQRQALTPGLVQMVSVLALNKLELREMINTEMIENPVLEELEETVSTLEERAGAEGEQERSAEEKLAESDRVEKDPFDEIDFGSYFQDYLDPGFRTASNFEEYDKPSFEHFLAQPSTLTDHLTWQLGSLTLTAKVRVAAELIIGNLNEDGYLTATDEELIDLLQRPLIASRAEPIPFERGIKHRPVLAAFEVFRSPALRETATGETAPGEAAEGDGATNRSAYTGYRGNGASSNGTVNIAAAASGKRPQAGDVLLAALTVVHQLDPIGVGARDLRECLLLQVAAQQREAALVLKRRARYQADRAVETEFADEALPELPIEPAKRGVARRVRMCSRLRRTS